MKLVGAAALALALIVAACTFADLGNYPAPGCSPSAPSFSLDECSSLYAVDAGGGTVVVDLFAVDCHAVAQCAQNGASNGRGICQAAPLDVDRDGDPNAACGGNDCADDDAKRSSLLHEVCDQIDNDCSGVADDNLPWTVSTPAPTTTTMPPPPLVLGGGTGSWWIDDNGYTISYLTPQQGDHLCIAVRAFNDPWVAQRGPCTFVAGGPTEPRQPIVRVNTATQSLGYAAYAAVYVNANTGDASCTQRIELTNDLGGRAVAPCLAPTASHPGFAVLGDGSRGIVVYSDAPLATTASECASAAPATIRFLYVRDPFGAHPELEAGGVLATNAVTTGPVDVAAVPLPNAPFSGPMYSFSDFLAAVPDGSGVSVWAFWASSSTSLPPSGIQGGAFVRLGRADIADVRGLVSAVRAGVNPELGFVAQSGCASASFTFGYLQPGVDTRTNTLTTQPIDAAPASDAPPWLRLIPSLAYDEFRLVASTSQSAFYYRIAHTAEQPYYPVITSFPSVPGRIAATPPALLPTPRIAAFSNQDALVGIDPTTGVATTTQFGCKASQ
jgi:hypothetical protein